jgi:type IV secretion system protein TrbL
MLGAVRAGTAMGSAASTAYGLGQEAAGSSSVGAGMSGIAKAAGSAMRRRASGALGVREAAESGRAAAWSALTGTSPANEAKTAGGARPGWARELQRRQDARQHRHLALQTLRDGDRGGAGATPDISEKEE